MSILWMDAPGCGNHSRTGVHFGGSHLFPTGRELDVQRQPSSEHVRLGSEAARKQSQEEDGLIRVPAKDEKDDGNLGHTRDK